MTQTTSGRLACYACIIVRLDLKKDAYLILACGHGNLLGWLLLKCAKLEKHNRAHSAILFYQSLTLLSHVATSK